MDGKGHDWTKSDASFIYIDIAKICFMLIIMYDTTLNSKYYSSLWLVTAVGIKQQNKGTVSREWLKSIYYLICSTLICHFRYVQANFKENFNL